MTELNEPIEKPADEQNVTPNKAMDTTLGLFVLMGMVIVTGLYFYADNGRGGFSLTPLPTWTQVAYTIGFTVSMFAVMVLIGLIGLVFEWLGIKQPYDPNVTPDNDWPPTPKEWLGICLALLWSILGFTLFLSGILDFLPKITVLAVPLGFAAILWWLAPRQCTTDRPFELKK